MFNDAKLWRAIPGVVLMAFILANTSYGQEVRVQEGPALALGRYIAALQDRNAFTEAGPIEVEIDATLPASGKQGSMRAIRETGASERSEYRAAEFTGDPTVKREVIARYLSAQEQVETLPYSSIAVTPKNYKFRYLGSVRSGTSTAYVFQTTPRQKRNGLLEGQIWIDSETGIVVHQTGRFVKQPSVFVRRIEVIRDTEIRDGSAWARVTHLAIDIRIFGRTDLTITERPVERSESTVSSEICPVDSLSPSSLLRFQPAAIFTADWPQADGIATTWCDSWPKTDVKAVAHRHGTASDRYVATSELRRLSAAR